MERAPTDFPASSAEKTSSIVKTTSTITANYMPAPTAATEGWSLSLPRCLLLSKRSEAARGGRLPNQDSPQLGWRRLRSVEAATEGIAYPCPSRTGHTWRCLESIPSPRPFVHLSVGQATPDRRRGVGNDLKVTGLRQASDSSSKNFFFFSFRIHAVDETILAPEPTLLLVRSNRNLLFNGCCPSRRLFFVYPCTESRHTHPPAVSFTKTKNKRQYRLTQASIGRCCINFLIFLAFGKWWERRTWGEGKDTRRHFLWIFTILISEVGVDGYVHGYAGSFFLYFSYPFSYFFFAFSALPKTPPTISSLLFFTCLAAWLGDRF